MNLKSLVKETIKEVVVERQINLFVEKNSPTNPSKWAYYKSQAKKKFDVYPSAYANAYASKICAGKIKDPSGLKRKDFKGPKPKSSGTSAAAKRVRTSPASARGRRVVRKNAGGFVAKRARMAGVT